MMAHTALGWVSNARAALVNGSTVSLFLSEQKSSNAIDKQLVYAPDEFQDDREDDGLGGDDDESDDSDSDEDYDGDGGGGDEDEDEDGGSEGGGGKIETHVGGDELNTHRV